MEVKLSASPTSITAQTIARQIVLTGKRQEKQFRRQYNIFLFTWIYLFLRFARFTVFTEVYNWTTVVEEEEAARHRSEDFLQISRQTVPLGPSALEVIRYNLAGGG